jgi:hypothetical protein
MVVFNLLLMRHLISRLSDFVGCRGGGEGGGEGGGGGKEGEHTFLGT